MWSGYFPNILATKYGIFKLFFLLKIEIHRQILNTKPFLCNSRGLRCMLKKLVSWFGALLILSNFSNKILQSSSLLESYYNKAFCNIFIFDSYYSILNMSLKVLGVRITETIKYSFNSRTFCVIFLKLTPWNLKLHQRSCSPIFSIFSQNL